MMPIKDWNFMYKCRCCGKIFNQFTTRGMSTLVIGVMSDFTLGKNVSDELEGSPTQTAIHYCDDNTFGLADFIGVTSNHI